MMRSLFFLALGASSVQSLAVFKNKKTGYSHTSKVSINGKVVGEGTTLDSVISKCNTDTESKVTEVEVCGCEVKVDAYLKTRCEQYDSYQATIGECDCAKGSGCEKVALKHGADDAHTLEAMSYQVSPC